jgi:O-antigen/teichoic acid export membrane protein
MIKRIIKMLGALGASNGITLITQLALPPAFLYYYDVRRYGEWLVLSATLSYLGTLNFGITTYASNELTILYRRGDMDKYRELQGSTLALLFCIIIIGFAVISAIFFLPLTKLLDLHTIDPFHARVVAFFLGLQMLANILGGYYNNMFMVVEEAHRGLSWYNARRLAATLISIPLVMLRVSFSVMAFGQFIAVLIIALLTIYDLKKRIGHLPLGLRGMNWKTAKKTLAPSGMFGMIFMQTFLIFQAPIIMLQWILGPEIVVFFSISRTIFSTARQMVLTITSAISPEITFSYADRDMKKLLNIFHYSETAVFAVIPVANLGTYLVSPILLQVWLHKPYLFDPYIYGLMALISGAMSMREHKQFFQFSTNTHKRLSIIVFFGNILMIAISIPFTLKYGLPGFLFIWLFSEVFQMGLIYHENRKLFNNNSTISLIPAIKLSLMMLVSLPICAWLVYYVQQRSLVLVGIAALTGILLLIAESYYVFGLKNVKVLLRQRFLHNVPS